MAEPKRTDLSVRLERAALVGIVRPGREEEDGESFDELHRQSWIAKMKADELIEAVEIHNSNFMRDPRFKTPDEAGMAALDISTLIDAGRFQEVPAERALLELQQLRQRTASK